MMQTDICGYRDAHEIGWLKPLGGSIHKLNPRMMSV